MMIFWKNYVLGFLRQKGFQNELGFVTNRYIDFL